MSEGRYTTVDSHSSMKTNDRLSELFSSIDFWAIQAQDKPHVDNIARYYNRIEQAYRNFTPILDAEVDDEITKLRRKYEALFTRIEEDASLRTKRSLRLLLSYVKEFNYLLVWGLQRQQYFFRTSTKTKKGLSYVSFQQSEGVFSTKKKDETATQDQ